MRRGVAALFLVACSGDLELPDLENIGEIGASEVTGAAPESAGVEPTAGFVGVVVARNRSDVSSSIGGVLVSVSVRPGDRVDAGAPIAVIDPSQVDSEIGVARAELRASLSARASAEVDLAEAGEKLSRFERVGRELADEVVGAEAGAAIRYAVKRARAVFGRADAEVQRHRRRIGLLESRRGQTRVTAPFAGTVANRYLDPGGVVAPGQPIVRLIESDQPWVRFAVPADQSSWFAVGVAIEVAVESRDEPLRAYVVQVAPEIDPVAKMVVIEARIEGDDAGQLRSGASAWVAQIGGDKTR